MGICTTDLYPKVRCAELTLPGGTGRIGQSAHRARRPLLALCWLRECWRRRGTRLSRACVFVCARVSEHVSVRMCAVGISKGAGMVEPNMATMLVYVLTDIVRGLCFSLYSHPPPL